MRTPVVQECPRRCYLYGDRQWDPRYGEGNGSAPQDVVIGTTGDDESKSADGMQTRQYRHHVTFLKHAESNLNAALQLWSRRGDAMIGRIIALVQPRNPDARVFCHGDDRGLALGSRENTRLMHPRRVS